MPDFQRRDAGLAGIARLEIGDHAPALVAQATQLVERGQISRCDEAAVAGEERQVAGERAGEPVDELPMLAEIALGLGQKRRQRRLRLKRRAHVRGLGQSVAEGCEIARAAAAQSEPRHRTRHVGGAPQ